MPNLTVLNGEEIGKTFSWTAEILRIGRHAANDFVVNNASVSGEHCLIEKCEGGWRVKDLDSTNGTRVNDVKVTLSPLHRNDVVSIGDIALSLRGEDVPEAEPGLTESIDNIPRTTIVMRPQSANIKTAEGFERKSEGKKMLNGIVIAIVVAIIVMIIALFLKLAGIL